MKWSKVMVLMLAVSLIVLPLSVLGQQITLKVVYFAPSTDSFAFNTWLQGAAKTFEAAHPGVKVDLVPITGSEGDYYTKLDLMMRSANTAPDIAYEDSFMIGSDAAAGFLKPIDEYVEAWTEWSHFYKAMRDIVKYKGKVYGVMVGTDVRGLWYNKALFRKAGIAVPWQPKSWADIIKTAEILKEKLPGVIPFSMYSGVPDDEASTMQGYEMLLYGTKMGNNALYDWNTGKWVICSQGIKDTLEFVKKVFTEKLAEPLSYALNPQYGSIVANELLPKGKLAIDLDGMWVFHAWQPNGSSPWPEWKETMGFALMPTQYGQAPHYVSLSGGWALSISSYSKHPELAWDFIKDAASAKELATFNKYIGGIAVRDDEADYPIYSNIPFIKYFTSVMKYTHYRPAFPEYPKISYQIDLAMENVMLNRPVEETMKGYADAVKGIVGPDKVECIK